MKKVITYGTYDLLHRGHIRLLERAKALGDYLIVGVTSDAFDKNRGKLNVQQSVVERVEAIRATGLADQIVVEEYEGQKISDIQKYNVDIFAIGSDWVGKFDYLNEYCNVVYLERTQGVSSTEIRAAINPVVKFGFIGLNNPTERILGECKFVNGLEPVCLWDSDQEKAKAVADKFELQVCDDIDRLLKRVDAVYISQEIDKHYELIRRALDADCHVICESPLVLRREQGAELFQKAEEKGLVLFEAIKTLFFPAFEHLLLIVNSGRIGSVKDIQLTSTNIPADYDKIRNDKYNGSMYDWGSVVLLPIIKLLGTNYRSSVMYGYEEEGFNTMVRGILQYDHATATFIAGKGIKSEGSMIITGTKGYIYIPAPWWKTDYFEIRYEDLRETKKYFYKYDGEGFRYELLEFIRMINNHRVEHYAYSRDEMLCAAQLMEQFDRGDIITIEVN